MESVFNGTNGGHDVQVSAKIPRRRFTAAYKLKIVREADGCSQPGELGALLRREGLYSSNLVTWRRARDRGELVNAPKRGRKPKPVDPSAKRVAVLPLEVSLSALHLASGRFRNPCRPRWKRFETARARPVPRVRARSRN